MTALLALIVLALPPPAPDKVLLRDGRLIEGQLVETPDEDLVVIRLPGAEVPIPVDLVEQTYIEDLQDYVPTSDVERDYLAKGWVLFEGRWMTRTRRESELRKRAEEDRRTIEELRRRQEWANARRFETLHFEVTTNCTDAVARDYADRLEQYYKEFTGAWRIRVAPSLRREKQEFFLYRNADDFRRITGQRPGVLGFFDWVEGELHLYHDDRDPSSTHAVLYHEGNHLLVHLIDPRFSYPRWMDEGMAEYFGSARVDDRGRFVVGEPQYSRIASLNHDAARGTSLGLEELLLTTQEDFSSRHYAAAWSLTHFLMESDEHGRAYRAFFGKLPENNRVEATNVTYRSLTGGALRVPDLASVVTALERALGRSLAELEAEWQRHREATHGELDGRAYHLAAKLTLASGVLDAETLQTAMDHLRRAVDLGVNDPDCYRTYAEMLRKGGVDSGGFRLIVQAPRLAEAWDLIQQAVARDPLDPFLYAEAGGILVQRARSMADVEEAAALAATARALAPRDPTVHGLVDELDSLIAAGQEFLAARAAEAAQPAGDPRVWVVIPDYDEDQPVPERIGDLATDDVLELIAAGRIKSADWITQAWRGRDPVSGALVPGPEAWDRGWVRLKAVPLFAEALQSEDAGP